MNQYQRMVSYLYQYHQGEKGENVGYVRVERKQQQCQIVIKMRPMTLEHMPEIRLFTQEPDGIVYVPAGNLSVGGNSLERKLVTMPDNVFQSGKSIESFEGLLLYVSAKTFFATSWKNDRIFLGDMRTFTENETQKNLHADDSMPDTYNPQNPGAKNAPDSHNSSTPDSGNTVNISGDSKSGYVGSPSGSYNNSQMDYQNIVGNSDDRQNANPDFAGNLGDRQNADPDFAGNLGDRQNADPKLSGNLGDRQNANPDFAGNLSDRQNANLNLAGNLGDRQNADPKLSGNLGDRQNANHSLLGRHGGSLTQNHNTPDSSDLHAAMVEGELAAAEENLVNISLQHRLKHNEPKAAQKKQAAHIEKSPEESEVEMQSVCSVCPFKRKTLDYGKRMLYTFPQMHPFPDGRIRECVRIEPQDIGCLPIRLWSLANNNFLLQGYFNYRHLLFLELRDGNYAIGVPGIFTQKEKGTARRFAFPQFMPLSSDGNCNGAFGYWLQTLPRTLA